MRLCASCYDANLLRCVGPEQVGQIDLRPAVDYTEARKAKQKEPGPTLARRVPSAADRAPGRGRAGVVVKSTGRCPFALARAVTYFLTSLVRAASWPRPA